MRRHRFAYAEARDATLAQYRRLVDVVAVVPDRRFSDPTRLGDWTVGELIAHLAASFTVLLDGLARPAPPRAELTLADYFRVTRQLSGGIAQYARDLAAGREPRELRLELEQAVDSAGAALADVPDRVIVTPAGGVQLSELLVSRCVEGVVHGLDLQDAVKLPGRPDDVADPTALRVVVRLIGWLLATEAPGRSVEVRVPGQAGLAIQCVEGPRHTRGKPANVVETDPVTFVEVGAGRLPWAEAVSTGRIRASGERADLSAYLPVVG